MFRTIDLFAGAGGIRLGFEQAGFECVFANDVDPKTKVTYDLNFDTTPMHVQDMRELCYSSLPDADFILGGFPCQAFSIAGHRQGFEDERDRGNLFFYICDMIKIKQPIGFMLENVKNLVAHNDGKTFKIIQHLLKELGYHIKFQVLNSMTHGNVPQNRERIFIVGFKDPAMTERFQFPSPIPRTVDVIDILDSHVDDKYYYMGKPLYDRIKDDVTDPNRVYQWRRQYVRENKSGVCPTLTANMGTGGHNVPIIVDDKGIRKLTPNECFKLQGFYEINLPDLSDASLYKQAGNSVSVPVIKRIAQNILLATHIS
jgi:DNA (cytosine-5)-methyltransferase 1